MNRAVQPARRSRFPSPRRSARILLEAVEPRLLLTQAGEHIPDIMVNPPAVDLTPYTGAAPLNFDTQGNGLPILHSNPSAPAEIYMDFDGEGTRTAYDEDSNPASFNAAEQTTIAEAWRQMSKVWSMFDVDVTTVFSSKPKAWLSVANNHTGVGYSYVNVFPNSKPESFNPAGDARTRVSGLEHEVGHNFGLSHQSTYDQWGTKTAEYASSVDAWHGVIMGVDYNGMIHKWFTGHPSGSVTSLQDDLAVIASDIKKLQPAGGDGFRPDDVGDSIATASPLPVVGAAQTTFGNIERRTDRDYFSFISAGDNYQIYATPDAPSPVDVKLEVYDDTGKLIAAADAVKANGQALELKLPAGTYYAVVSSHGDYGDLGLYEVGARTLPAEWTSVDISNVGANGYTGFDPATGTYTNMGTGGDVSNADDQFHFAYQQVTGDFTISARVTNVDLTDVWAKVGLDARENLNKDARHMSMVATGKNGPQLIWRTSPAGSAASSNTSGTPAFTPVWVRITRIGNSFRGYFSTDGVNWTQKGSTQTLAMASTIYIGMLTCSRDQASVNAGTLDNVSITGNIVTSNPTYNTLPAPTNLAVVLGAGSGLNLTWDAVEGATGYRVERSLDGVVFTTAGTTAAAVLTYADNNLTGAQRYFYRVVALDPTGASVPSDTASAVNRPSAPTGISIISVNTTTLVVDWKDVSGDSGYRVERSTDGVNFTPLTTVGVNVPSYTNTGLTVATAYTYRITPLSAQGDGVPVTVSGGTRLPVVTPMAFDNVASTTVTFHWTDIAGEANYRVQRSTDGTTWTTLTSAIPANVTTYTDTGLTPLKEYYYRVMGLSGTLMSVYPAALMVGTPSGALPAPWSATDIGLAPNVGTTSHTNGTFTVISGGSDIWGTSDQFRFTYQPVSGNAQIIAKVNSIENTDDWTKIGVMIRSSLAANAQNAAVFVTPGNGVSMQYRATTGGSSSSTAGNATAVAPYWLKITRIGNALTTYSSPDGSAWTQVGTVNIAMSSTVYIGLAASSRVSTSLNTATFTSVQVSPPAVLATKFNFRDQISLTFTTDVSASLQPGDLSVQTLPTGPTFTPDAVSWDAATKTATFGFSTPLPDGDYRATLAGSAVLDAYNFGLSSASTYTFFALAGDANRDRAVDFGDLTVLAQNYNLTSGATWAMGDFTGDGAVDFTDLVIVSQNYNKSLAAAPVAPTAPAPQKPTTVKKPAAKTLLAALTPFALQRVRTRADLQKLLA